MSPQHSDTLGQPRINGPHVCAYRAQLARCREAHAERSRALRPEAASPDTLKRHYLAEIVCDHDRKMDNPVCACSLVNLGWHPSVGEAVDAWIAHVVEVDRDEGTAF